MNRTTALRYNMQETIENWFDSYNIDTVRVEVQRDEDTNEFIEAWGKFKPVLFDKDLDGPKLSILYQLEVALVDERFEGTELIFDTDTKFRIV